MSEETETQPVNQDAYREVAIRIVKIVLDNQKSLPPPGVESSRPEAWKEVAGILRTHTAALQRRVESVRQETLEDAAKVVESHGSHPVKTIDPYSAWVVTPFYEKSKEIAKQIRQLPPPHEARG